MDGVRDRAADWLADRAGTLLGGVTGFVGGGCAALLVAPGGGGAVTGAVAAVAAAYGARWGRARGGRAPARR